jgi:phosphate/sulfate permease
MDAQVRQKVRNLLTVWKNVFPQSYRYTLNPATLKIGATTFFKVNNSNTKKKQGLMFQNTAIFIFLSVKKKTTNFINCGFMTCSKTLIKNWGWKIKLLMPLVAFCSRQTTALQVSADGPSHQRVYILIRINKK